MATKSAGLALGGLDEFSSWGVVILIGIDRAFEEAGLSLEDVAARAGLSRQRLEAIVAGRWLPNPDERERVARALGREVQEISWGHTMDPRNVRYRRFGLAEDF
jgi:transcriptional regulator with XRE-family HTH domain